MGTATVGSLAALVSGRVLGDEATLIDDVADLQSAGPSHLSFLANPKYHAQFLSTQAGAVLVAATHESQLAPSGKTLVLCDNPYLSMAQIAAHLHPLPRPPAGIHPQAMVHAEAQIHPSAAVSMGAIVESGAQIGSHTWVGAGAYVGANAQVGAECIIYPGAKVMHRCVLGDRVIVQAGAVIGGDGFGYAADAAGRRHKIPQVGIVVLEDDVEVGANATVDRATFGQTRIGAGTKIDNLVQVAHNVRTGRDCVLVSQAGIAGSTTLGDRVIVGAQGGMAGHIQVTSDVTLGGRAGVTNSIREPGIYSGTPVLEHKKWLRVAVSQQFIPELRRLVRSFETRLAALEVKSAAGNKQTRS